MRGVFSKFLLFGVVIFTVACNSSRNSNDNSSEPIEDTKPKQVHNYTLNDIQAEPYYKYAWHFAYNRSFGQYYGIDPDANIHIEKAWRLTMGKGVTVAVIDASNFDWRHEDLKENVIRIYNSDEDNNHISNEGESDDPSHGSTVAGFIASPINGKGLVGAAPEAKLILIKQIDSSDAATIAAFNYAIRYGAKVINCSWGTSQVSEGVAKAFEEFKEDGITIIFASGNDKEQGIGNLDRYGINDESELPSVIGVGASNEKNDIASYSNYGENIDLIAPGGSLTVSSGILGIDDSGVSGSDLQRGVVNENYAFTNGTSFSAPITSGVVALMLSINPTLTPDQIRDILIRTCDKIGGNSANYINGFDRYRAYGKLNAAKAVQMAKDY